MGWRGVLRDMRTASRRAEREAYRHHRSLQKQYQKQERLDELERVSYEVAVYENHIELLLSVHKECGAEWDWRAVYSSPPPAPPTPDDYHEQKARRALTRYQPSIWDRMFGWTEGKRTAFKRAVADAKEKDLEDRDAAVEEYKVAKADWDNSRQFAARILAGDISAYSEAVQETSPFSDMAVLGSSIDFTFTNPMVVQAQLLVNGVQAVPMETKTQLKSGKLSVKPMPTGRFNEIYQDYVCGAVLRVARELFALLPVNMVVVTAFGELLNTQTGHLEKTPILSVAIPRETARRIQWEFVDPSDTMANFVHRMCFKKSKGLYEIAPLQLSELRI